TGDDDSSEIYWIDLPLTKNREKFAATDLSKADEKTFAEIAKTAKPYEWENIEKSRTILEKIDSASPNDLRQIDHKENHTPNHVLRQRDLIDLFDTTADLSGFDLDVSRFVRGGEERDISVYWRSNVEETIKPVKGTKKERKELAKMLAPHRDELCSVPIYDAKAFIDKKKAWTFDTLSGEWREIKKDNLRTGIIILLDAESGGYDKIGWNPKSKAVIPVEHSETKSKLESAINTEAIDDDNQTYETEVGNKFISYTQTLTAHSLEVRQSAIDILAKLELSELNDFRDRIISAAHHHDLGKAHDFFQTTLHKAVYGEENAKKPFAPLLAKSAKQSRHGKERNNFRHELASALALIEKNRTLPVNEKHDDLEIYLVAAHHGKVRLSIRALPDEKKPKNDDGKFQPERRFARGIWDDDKLPATDLGDGVIFPETILNLDALTLGKNDENESSWLERMINVRDDLGVFRLAYLEAIVRAADVQASAKPQNCFKKGETENDK
ncbi:MAG: CRISPR-associated endonuclease Cas3'', partial [Pyrinomonadaceae bacterium]|nr:CRISPR-associated endonuclease Cas3'' [Pyrinomonadaceae bacterium]